MTPVIFILNYGDPMLIFLIFLRKIMTPYNCFLNNDDPMQGISGPIIAIFNNKSDPTLICAVFLRKIMTPHNYL